MRRIIPLSAFLLVSLVACERKPKPPAATQESGLAVARLNDRVISEQDILTTIQRAEAEFPQKFATHPQKKALLDQMINIELLYQEALKAGVDKRFEFKSRMVDLYVRDLAQSERARTTEEVLKKIYAENRDQIDQISARHILLKIPKGATKSAIKEVRKKVEEIYARVTASPNQFEEVAKSSSEDGAAKNGGELGYFSKGMMVPEFSKAAFALKKVGEISPIVETEFGFHIIQLTGDRRGFEFHKDLVRDRVLKDRQRDFVNSEIARLRATSKIEVFEDNLAKLSPLPDIVNQNPKENLQWNVDKLQKPKNP